MKASTFGLLGDMELDLPDFRSPATENRLCGSAFQAIAPDRFGEVEMGR
ncbi:MAG: hypothetical protein KDK35_20365 [Leptospiraceae bacterium]|nr:hypothetical protein [Leptospiraceae bacterium]